MEVKLWLIVDRGSLPRKQTQSLPYLIPKPWIYGQRWEYSLFLSNKISMSHRGLCLLLLFWMGLLLQWLFLCLSLAGIDRLSLSLRLHIIIGNRLQTGKLDRLQGYSPLGNVNIFHVKGKGLYMWHLLKREIYIYIYIYLYLYTHICICICLCFSGELWQSSKIWQIFDTDSVSRRTEC